MKARLLLSIAAALALACFAGSPLRAQERGDHHEHHWDKHDPRFDDHEREDSRRWMAEHHGDRDRPRGFRDEDRLPEGWEPRLVAGFVLDRPWRDRCYAVPNDLLVRLPPPPRHYRYYVVGGHIILVDNDWRVHDVIHLELNF